MLLPQRASGLTLGLLALAMNLQGRQKLARKRDGALPRATLGFDEPQPSHALRAPADGEPAPVAAAVPELAPL